MQTKPCAKFDTFIVETEKLGPRIGELQGMGWAVINVVAFKYYAVEEGKALIVTHYGIVCGA